MPSETLPNPKHALGIDKASYDLVERARGRARSAGFDVDLGALLYEQNRHYIYPVRANDKTLYVFFDWYSDGTLWYAPSIYAEGTRIGRNALAYDKADKAFKTTGGGAPEDAFVSALKEAFEGVRAAGARS